MKIQEQWKPVPVEPYGEVYSVSNLGRVRRDVSLSGGVSGKVLKGFASDKGYWIHGFRHGRGNRRTCSAHKLVALAFVPGFEEGLEVNHKDGDKQNNVATNLEWVTHLENMRHCVEVIETMPSGENSGMSKLNWDLVDRCRRRVASGETCQQVAQSLSLTTPTVRYAVVGHTWKNPPKGVVVAEPFEVSSHPSRAHVKRLSEEAKADIITRVLQGERQSELAAEYCVSRPNVCRMLKRYAEQLAT